MSAATIAVECRAVVDTIMDVSATEYGLERHLFLGFFSRMASHAAEGANRKVRKIRAKLVLRLRSEGLSRRQIAAQGMSRRLVDKVIAVAGQECLADDDVANMSESDVYTRLFPSRGEHQSVYAPPNWGQVHRELARVGVTLKLLHRAGPLRRMLRERPESHGEVQLDARRRSKCR